MQLRIYYKLNVLLGILSTAVLIAGAILFFNFDKLENKMSAVVIFMIIMLAIYFIYKMIENNYDKRMIQKMVLKGDIALATIKSAKPLKTIKDSGFKVYNLWEIEVEYYDQKFKKHEYTLIDKFNATLTEVPKGSVYITHDEAKPDQKFIIQNVMIGHVPTLQPIVAAYEKNKAIPVKYLNVYYRDGLVVETYQSSLKGAKENY